MNDYTAESLRLLTDAQLYKMGDFIQATTITKEDRERCFPLLMNEHRRRQEERGIIRKSLFEGK